MRIQNFSTYLRIGAVFYAKTQNLYRFTKSKYKIRRFFLTKTYFVIVFLKLDIYFSHTLGALKIKKEVKHNEQNL